MRLLEERGVLGRQREAQVLARRLQDDVAVAVPPEQLVDAVLLVRDEPVDRHRRAHDHVAHGDSLQLATDGLVTGRAGPKRERWIRRVVCAVSTPSAPRRATLVPWRRAPAAGLLRPARRRPRPRGVRRRRAPLRARTRLHAGADPGRPRRRRRAPGRRGRAAPGSHRTRAGRPGGADAGHAGAAVRRPRARRGVAAPSNSTGWAGASRRPSGPRRPATAQVLAAALRSADAVQPDALLVTGDLVDGAQANELDWVIGLLDGDTVTPDSGAPGYNGLQDQSGRSLHLPARHRRAACSGSWTRRSGRSIPGDVRALAAAGVQPRRPRAGPRAGRRRPGPRGLRLAQARRARAGRAAGHWRPHAGGRRHPAHDRLGRRRHLPRRPRRSAPRAARARAGRRAPRAGRGRPDPRRPPGLRPRARAGRVARGARHGGSRGRFRRHATGEPARLARRHAGGPRRRAPADRLGDAARGDARRRRRPRATGPHAGRRRGALGRHPSRPDTAAPHGQRRLLAGARAVADRLPAGTAGPPPGRVPGRTRRAGDLARRPRRRSGVRRRPGTRRHLPRPRLPRRAGRPGRGLERHPVRSQRAPLSAWSLVRPLRAPLATRPGAPPPPARGRAPPRQRGRSHGEHERARERRRPARARDGCSGGRRSARRRATASGRRPRARARSPAARPPRAARVPRRAACATTCDGSAPQAGGWPASPPARAPATISESRTIAPQTSPVTTATTRSSATMVSTNGAPGRREPGVGLHRSPRASSRAVSSPTETPASGGPRPASAPGRRAAARRGSCSRCARRPRAPAPRRRPAGGSRPALQLGHEPAAGRQSEAVASPRPTSTSSAARARGPRAAAGPRTRRPSAPEGDQA